MLFAVLGFLATFVFATVFFLVNGESTEKNQSKEDKKQENNTKTPEKNQKRDKENVQSVGALPNSTEQEKNKDKSGGSVVLNAPSKEKKLSARVGR